MKLKPKTYYKRYYKWENPDSDGDWYAIYYTGNKWVYKIASKYNNNPLVKYTKNELWTIEEWQEHIKHRNIKTKIMSKEDVFLELL